MRLWLGTIGVGLALGFSLSRIGFSSWDELHRMFTFADLRMFLAFLLAAALLVPFWIVVGRMKNLAWPKRRIHRGSLLGGLLFGVGWAICGACPAIALVQLGEGQLGALWTVVGMFIGNWGYAFVHERYLRWPSTGCLDD